MSIRTRLALWHAIVALAVLGALALAAFVTHVQALYDDLDRELRDEAETARDLAPPAMLEGEHRSATGSSPVALTVYDSSGQVTFSTGDTPPLGLSAALAQDDGPAYPDAVRLFGGGIHAPAGAFATTRTGGERLRLFTLPGQSAVPTVLAWTSLDRTDRAVQQFALLLFVVAALGTSLIGICSYALAGRMLRPVVQLTRAAEAIASSGLMNRRVAVSGRSRDELRILGMTFNRMLSVIQASQEQQTRFLAAAAHELRTPLTLIRGNLQLVEGNGKASRAEREALGEALVHAHRLSALTDDLLTLARSDSGTALARREIPLEELLLDVVTGISPDARRRVSIDAVTRTKIDGDAPWLRLLLTNVLANSLQYSSAESTVRVAMAVAHRWVTITITDAGIGMTPIEAAQAFQRFFRAEAARDMNPSGTGLGLAIAKWTAEAHGGDIRITSARDCGTTVTIRLPISDALWPPPSLA